MQFLRILALQRQPKSRNLTSGFASRLEPVQHRQPGSQHNVVRQSADPSDGRMMAPSRATLGVNIITWMLLRNLFYWKFDSNGNGSTNVCWSFCRFLFYIRQRVRCQDPSGWSSPNCLKVRLTDDNPQRRLTTAWLSSPYERSGYGLAVRGDKNTARLNERNAWKVDCLIKWCIGCPYDDTLESWMKTKAKARLFPIVSQGPVKWEGAMEALQGGRF